MSSPDVVVLRFAGRTVPRPLANLPVVDVTAPADVDAAVGTQRLVVLGNAADLATVLTRLLRTDRLDVEVGFVGHRWAARRAKFGRAQRVPLIRDETGSVIVRSALWLPVAGPRLEGEAVVDDTTLFRGQVTGVRIEPTATMPGLRARVLTTGLRPRRWVTGRAVQLGTVAAVVLRDGVAAPRAVQRSTFYRHTHGWLAVR